MAGVIQHILPKFLLKGFAGRIEGKEKYFWVYRSDGKIFESNIKNTSVGRYFYGRERELSVDDDITTFENEYAAFLDELRAHQGKLEISDHRVPNLIAHIVTRTKHLRDSLRNSAEFIAERVNKYFSNSANANVAISKKINGEYKNRLINNRIPRYLRRNSQRLLKRKLPDFLNSYKNDMEKIRKSFFAELETEIPKIAKTAHIKGLSQGLIPEARVEDYQRLQWAVCNTYGTLILGDIGCLFDTASKKRFKSITFADDKILNIFLPISDQQILVGTSFSEIPQIDHNIINKETAKCSREYFICSKRSKIIESLIDLLGTEADIISEEELDQFEKKLFMKYGVN